MHSTIMYIIVTWARPADDDLEVYGSMIYLSLIALMFVRQFQLIQSFTSFVLAFLVFILVFFFASISIIDVWFYNLAYLLTHDLTWGYTVAFLVCGTVIALEYASAGARRLFFPRPTEVLMEIERGHGSETDVSEFEEARSDGGYVKSVVLPKSLVSAAFAKFALRRRSLFGGPAEDQVVAARVQDSPQPFGSKRSGFASSAPSSKFDLSGPPI
jgi:hypothetical protein